MQVERANLNGPVVGFFWDIENCQLPAAVSVSDFASHLRGRFAAEGPEVQFACYCRPENLPDVVRKNLQHAGIDVVDTFDGKANASDLKILAALDTFARLYKAPGLVVLITGDADFCPKVRDLQQRGYAVTLIHNEQARADLMAAASKCFGWSDLLPTMTVVVCSYGARCRDLSVDHRQRTSHPLPQGQIALILQPSEIPSSCYGLVIGKKGCTVKEICAETGANVTVPRKDDLDVVGILLMGTAAQVDSARARIRRICGNSVVQSGPSLTYKSLADEKELMKAMESERAERLREANQTHSKHYDLSLTQWRQLSAQLHRIALLNDCDLRYHLSAEALEVTGRLDRTEFFAAEMQQLLLQRAQGTYPPHPQTPLQSRFRPASAWDHDPPPPRPSSEPPPPKPAARQRKSDGDCSLL